MNEKGIYYDLITTDEDRRMLAQEGLIFDVSQLLWECLEDSGVSRAELARRLGTSRAYITKLLRGYSNLTLRSLADIFHALGKEIVIKAASVGCVNNVLLISHNWDYVDEDGKTGQDEPVCEADPLLESSQVQGAA